MQHHDFIHFVVDKIDDMKANDIVTIDVRGQSNITDTLIVCSGTSKRHVQSIARYLANQVRANGEPVLGLEGETIGEWVLVDLGEIVVHVMQEQARDYFQLEKLWN